MLRKFINEERLYIWMLIFIIGFTAILFGSEALSPEARAAKIKREAELREMMDHTQELLREKLPSNREELEAALARADPLIITYLVLTSLGTLAMGVGFVLTIIFIGCMVARRELIKPTTRPGRARWGVWDVCKVAIIFCFFGYLIKILQEIFARAGILPKELPVNLTMVVDATILDLICLYFIGYFVVGKYRERWSSLGLTLKGWLKGCFQGLAGYVTILPTLCLILFLLSLVCAWMKYQPPPHPIISVFLMEKQVGIILYSIFLGVVVGPVVEEIFFRGFAYSAIKKRMGVGGALLISSAIFALVHMNIFSFLPMMFLGIVMAYLYEKTGSLIPSITLHIVHNSILICLILLVRGIIA